MDWHLEVDGKPYHVTTERSPNGKIAVRANGRIVAPPQAAGAIDCRVQLGNAAFHLSGTEESMRLDPVIVIQTPSPAPPPLAAKHAFHPLDLRAVVFLIIGVLLFLVSSCSYLGTVKPHLEEAQRAEVDQNPELQNLFALHSAVRFALALAAWVGVAAIAGSAMLFRRMRSSLMILEIASWAVVGVPAFSFFIIDLLAHRQVGLVNDARGALAFARMLHTIEGTVLVLLGIAAGILSSFLSRRQMLNQFA